MTSHTGITAMQLAFVQSKDVTTATPLGKMILQMAQRHLEETRKALELEQAIYAETKRVIDAMVRQPGESLPQFLIRISEAKAGVRAFMTQDQKAA